MLSFCQHSNPNIDRRLPFCNPPMLASFIYSGGGHGSSSRPTSDQWLLCFTNTGEFYIPQHCRWCSSVVTHVRPAAAVFLTPRQH